MAHDTKKPVTRCDKRDFNKRPLTIVRDQNQFKVSERTAHNQSDSTIAVEQFKKFNEDRIGMPDEQKKLLKEQEKQALANPGSNSDESTIADDSIKPLEQAFKIAHGYDYFENVKMVDPSTSLKYQKINLDRFGVDPVESYGPTSYYHKQIEKVNSELQKTYDKTWSYKETEYEITEDMIGQLTKHGIMIDPGDAEIIIDCWEKVAINEEKRGKEVLKQRFKELFKDQPALLERISDQTLEAIHKCWMDQREQRKHRSFIRRFWKFDEDPEGKENIKVFLKHKQEKRWHDLRANQDVKKKIRMYGNKFIERENAVLFCETMQNSYDKLLCQFDSYKLEDAQFDLMIGKPVEPRIEQAIQTDGAAGLTAPTISKDKEQEIGSSLGLKNGDNVQVASEFMKQAPRKLEYRVKCSQVALGEKKRYFHRDLRLKQEPFNVPIENPRKPGKQVKPPLKLSSSIDPKADVLMEPVNLKRPSDKTKIALNKKGTADVVPNMQVAPLADTKKKQPGGRDRRKQSDLPEAGSKAQSVMNEPGPQNNNDMSETAVTNQDVLNNLIKQMEKEQSKSQKKIRKSLNTSLEFIQMFTMVKHNLEKMINLKLTSDQTSKKVIDSQNKYELLSLMQKGYVEESKENGKTTMVKNWRRIQHDVNSYKVSLQSSIFDINHLSRDKKEPLPDLSLEAELKKECLEKKKELQKIEEQYMALKKRCLVPRRGRCHQVFLKPITKNIFGYESSDEDACDNYLDVFNNTKEGKEEQIEILQEKKKIKLQEGFPVKNEERRRRAMKKVDKFCKPIDQHLSHLKGLIEEMEHDCFNKRQVKQVYKLNFNAQLGTVSNLAQKEETKEEQPDSVINKLFKKRHFESFNEIMGQEADQALKRANFQPNAIYEGDGSTNQKLEDYNDMLNCKNKRQRTEQGSIMRYEQDMEPEDPSNGYPTSSSLQSSPPFLRDEQGKNQGLKSTERADLMSHLRFLKEGGFRMAIHPGARDTWFENNVNNHQQMDESLLPSGANVYQKNGGLVDMKSKYKTLFGKFKRDIGVSQSEIKPSMISRTQSARY